MTKVLELGSLISKFEHILPEDLPTFNDTDLLTAKSKFKEIQSEDLKSIKELFNSLSIKKNKSIRFDKFEKDIHYVIKKAFQVKNEESNNQTPFYFAHWHICKIILEDLLDKSIKLFLNLKNHYSKYQNKNNSIFEKKTNYFYYSRLYLDFNGCLISINKLLEQYYDHLVLLRKHMDPTINEKTIIAYSSDTFIDEFLQGTNELLLRGNYGRLTGFSLLRSALEVSIQRDLFNLKNSTKYSNHNIKLLQKIYIDDICNVIESLSLTDFPIDPLRRMYDWQSIFIHTGLRTKEYILWFSYYYMYKIINDFSKNLRIHKDTILEELVNENMIELTPI